MTKRRRASVAGLAVDVLAEAFRVKPFLERAGASEGRQLREWRSGQAKELETQRQIIRAMLAPVFQADDDETDKLGGPLPDREIGEIVEDVLARWVRWIDGVFLGQAALGPDWITEHTLNLCGAILGTVRYAWGAPVPESPSIKDWLPSSFDSPDRSIPGEFLENVLEAIRQDGSTLSVVDRLAAARSGSRGAARSGGGGAAVKPATLKRWARGETLPNGERPDEIGSVAGDPLLRVKLGMRALVERLAMDPAGSEQNRNATLLWLVHVECRAIDVHRMLADRRVDAGEALRGLADKRVLTTLLPQLTADVTAECLPFRLRERVTVLIEAKQDDKRVGLILVPVR